MSEMLQNRCSVFQFSHSRVNKEKRPDRQVFSGNGLDKVLKVVRIGASNGDHIHILQRLDTDCYIGDKAGNTFCIRDKIEIGFAEVSHGPIGQNDTGTYYIVAEPAGFIRSDTGTTLGKPSPHGRSWITCGVRCQGETMLLQMPVKFLPYNARLDGRCESIGINGNDAIHPVKIDNDTLLYRKNTAISRRCFAARREGYFAYPSPFDEVDKFFFIYRLHYSLRYGVTDERSDETGNGSDIVTVKSPLNFVKINPVSEFVFE